MAARRTEVYTVVVVGDAAQAVRRFQVTRTSLVRAAWAGAGLALLLLLAVGHQIWLVRSASKGGALRDENRHLRAQLALVQERLAHISATLQRVEQLDVRLRSSAVQLQDPDRSAAPAEGRAGGTSSSGTGGAGGTGGSAPSGSASAPRPGSAGADSDAPPAGAIPTGLAEGLAALAEEASLQEKRLHEVQSYFDDQRALLASTPSVWPARGWVTSDFGTRMDPYTARRKMHEGLDIATPQGQPVYSPSDGTVSFAGIEGGYGRVLVIDHGNGMKTRYGHVSEIFVHAGDRVRKGDKVAAVGSTGRSTGPHLHYEVRVNGTPENPRMFILE